MAPYDDTTIKVVFVGGPNHAKQLILTASHPPNTYIVPFLTVPPRPVGDPIPEIAHIQQRILQTRYYLGTYDPATKEAYYIRETVRCPPSIDHPNEFVAGCVNRLLRLFDADSSGGLGLLLKASTPVSDFEMSFAGCDLPNHTTLTVLGLLNAVLGRQADGQWPIAAKIDRYEDGEETVVALIRTPPLDTPRGSA